MSRTQNKTEAAVDAILEAAHSFGLDRDDVSESIADLIGAGADSCPPRRGLHLYLTGSDEGAVSDDGFRRTPGEALRDLIANSRVGIQADAKYWNDMPERHTGETLAHHGYEVEFTDSSGDPISVLLEDGDMSMRISVRDSDSGLTISTRFEYPDTELRTNNYPALIREMNRDVLAPLNLTYVQLAGDETEWRFALIDADRLSLLKQTYGDRLMFPGIDEPVLSSTELGDYLTDPIPTEHDVETTEEQTGEEELGEMLLTDGEEDVEGEAPDPVTAEPVEEPSADNTMTGGVLDFGAINNATKQQDADQDVSLDEDVESVITEAESMLEGQDITEDIFGEETTEDEVADELDEDTSDEELVEDSPDDVDTESAESSADASVSSEVEEVDRTDQSETDTADQTDTDEEQSTEEPKGLLGRIKQALLEPLKD